MSTFTKVNSLALFEYCPSYCTTVALHYFNFCTKFITKIYQTFSESQHMAWYFSCGSASPGSPAQARVMTLWVNVTFILSFATLDINIYESHIYSVAIIKIWEMIVSKTCYYMRCVSTHNFTFAVSICAWVLKCQFGSLLQTRNKIDFESNLIFFSSLNLIFNAYVAYKNQFRNQIDFLTWYFEIEKK